MNDESTVKALEGIWETDTDKLRDTIALIDRGVNVDIKSCEELIEKVERNRYFIRNYLKNRERYEGDSILNFIR